MAYRKTAFRRKYNSRASGSRYKRTTGARKVTRRRTTKYRRNIRPALGSSTMTSSRKLGKYPLSQIDPFDERVSGVKLPDANTVPSASLCLQDEVILPTVLQTCACFAFLPMPSAQSVTAVSATASTWAWPSGYTVSANTKNATVISSYTALRPIAHAIRLSCGTAPTTTVGFVHIGLGPVDGQAATGWASTKGMPTSLADMSNLGWYRRYPLSMFTQKTLTVVNKFLDDTSQRYMSSSAANGGYGTAGATTNSFGVNWCTVFVAVEGVATGTNALNADIIMHLEGLPSIGGLIQASPAAPSDPREFDNTSFAAANVAAAHWDDEAAANARQFVNGMNEAAAVSGSGSGASTTFDYPAVARYVYRNRRAIADVARLAIGGGGTGSGSGSNMAAILNR